MVARRVCVVARGCVWLWGGMCGCWGGVVVGVCVVARGACMVVGDAWLLGGVHGCWGACVVAEVGGVRRIRQDTVNERAVRILLECILVRRLFLSYFIKTSPFGINSLLKSVLPTSLILCILIPVKTKVINFMRKFDTKAVSLKFLNNRHMDCAQKYIIMTICRIYACVIT